MARTSALPKQEIAAGFSVFGHTRKASLPTQALPPELSINSRLSMNGIKLLEALQDQAYPVCFFDPQYRGVMDKQKYGNEGSRQKGRALLPQMGEGEISSFIRQISRVLIPSGHLFFWLDKFHLCVGFREWLHQTDLNVVDLITWNKSRIGMGYRTRRTSEYLLVLQKLPIRAKGVWTSHNIPDCWTEKVGRAHPHAKPIGLQQALIEAVTSPGDTVLDPAAGSFSVMTASLQSGRNFLGCDLEVIDGAD